MSRELFDIVDENDEVIGQTSRKECHRERMIHRSVMFFVFDEKGRVLVTKRTRNKDFFPGYWSIAMGGHVHSGESYEEAAAREIAEETGLTGEPFFLTSFKKRIPEERENVQVYGMIAHDKMMLDEDELEKGEFLDLNELEERIKFNHFLPETETLLSTLKEHLSSQSRQKI